MKIFNNESIFEVIVNSELNVKGDLKSSVAIRMNNDLANHMKEEEINRLKEIADEIAKVFMEKIQKIYNLNNVSIIDKAEDSIAPYNVNYLKDNAIYILVGLVLSCGTIFIFFYFDTTIKSSEEIESKLGLNVIGSVPKVEKE